MYLKNFFSDYNLWIAWFIKFIHLVKNMQNISNTYLHKNPINLMLKNKQEDILNVSMQFQIFDHESKDQISSENFFICSAHRRTSIFRASSSVWEKRVESETDCIEDRVSILRLGRDLIIGINTDQIVSVSILIQQIQSWCRCDSYYGNQNIIRNWGSGSFSRTFEEIDLWLVLHTWA